MVRQKRYTKRRRSHRRSSRKMRGGLVETDRQVLTGLGFTDEQINYLFANNPDMMIEFFQNSINPPLDASGNPSNHFFTEAQTPDQIIHSLQQINDDYDGNNSEGNTTHEAISFYSLNNSLNSSLNSSLNNNLNNGALDISEISEDPLNDELDVSVITGSEQNTLSEESIDNSLELGGKRKSKRRTTNKRKTKKSKTKKSRKTRKNKKRKHRGGGFTTSEMNNPIAYKEDEYDQFKNALNYNPSKQ